MIAILRYQLLDIRLVVSRFALYLVLSAFVIAGYLGLITLLDRVVGAGRSVDRTRTVSRARRLERGSGSRGSGRILPVRR